MGGSGPKAPEGRNGGAQGRQLPPGFHDEPTVEAGRDALEPRLGGPSPDQEAPAPPRPGLVTVGAMGGGVVLGAGAAVTGVGVAAVLVALALAWWSTTSAPPAPPAPIALTPAPVPQVVPVPVPVLSVVPVPVPVPVPVEQARPDPISAAQPPPIEIVARAPEPPRAATTVEPGPVVWWSTSDRKAAPAPAAPAPPASAPVRFVTDPPGADVVVDDLWKGRTPLALALGSDSHRVTIENGRSKLRFVLPAGAAGDQCYVADGSEFVAGDCR